MKKKLTGLSLEDLTEPLPKNKAFEKFVKEHLLTGEGHLTGLIKEMCQYDESIGRNVFYALTPVMIKLLRQEVDEGEISVETNESGNWKHTMRFGIIRP